MLADTFPLLTIIKKKKVFSIPAIFVPAERVFSAGNIISARRIVQVQRKLKNVKNQYYLNSVKNQNFANRAPWRHHLRTEW